MLICAWSRSGATEKQFEGLSIKRLGVARSIILNVAITVPLGYLLPAVLRFVKHKFLWTIVTVLVLSLITELVQLISRTGLAETDDVINNVIGTVIGMFGYWIAVRGPQNGAACKI